MGDIAALKARLAKHTRPEAKIAKPRAAVPSAPALAVVAKAPAAAVADAPSAAALQPGTAMGVHTAQGVIHELDGQDPGAEWEATLRKSVGDSAEAWLSFLRHADSLVPDRTKVLTMSTCATIILPRAALRKTEPYIQVWLHRAALQLAVCSDPQEAKQTLEYMRVERIGQDHVGFFITKARVENKRGNPGKAEKALRDGFDKCPDFSEQLCTAWQEILRRPCVLDAPAAEEEQTMMVSQMGTGSTTTMPASAAPSAEEDGTATICVGAANDAALLKTPAADETVQINRTRGSSTKKDRKPLRRLGALSSKSAGRVDSHTADVQAAAEAAAAQMAAEAADARSTARGHAVLEPIGEANSSVEASSAEGTPTVGADEFHTAYDTVIPELPTSPGSTFKRGDLVAVHSKSLQQWFDGHVLSIITEEDAQSGEIVGDVKVTYGNGIIKCVDPTDRTSIRHQTQPPETEDVESVQPREQNEKPKASLSDRIKELETIVQESKESFVFQGGGTYKRLGVYGKGGSCKVFKVIDNQGNIAALKRVKGDAVFQTGDDREYEPFVNEIELLRKLNNETVCNPNIILLHDAAVSRKNKAVYMVFEPGEIDLHKLLQKNEGQQSFKDNYIRLYWQQMLEAVNTIHNERIVHSDLKPANFLMVAGTLKLIDFGIAKGIEGMDTTNIVRENQVGTMNYMSPEAFAPPETDNEFKLSRKSDIWSLGCILYQMVYGKTPFHHIRNQLAKIRAITDCKHEIKFPPHPDKMLLATMKSCFNRDYTARPSIPDLLKHPYVTGGMATAAAAATPAEPASNAQLQEILQKVASGDVAAEDLLRQLSAGATTEDLSEVLRRQPSHVTAKAKAAPSSRSSAPVDMKRAASAPALSVHSVPSAPAPPAQTADAGRAPIPSRCDLNQQIAMGHSKLKKAGDRDRRPLKPGKSDFSSPLTTSVINSPLYLALTQLLVYWPVGNTKPPTTAENLLQQLAKRRQATAEETSELTGTTSDEWK
jgi:serine/threonine-protein kinase TTK/MPS1